YPGFANSIWLGLFGPAGIPEAVLVKLRAEIKRALESPDLKEKFNAAGGLEPYVLSPEDFATLIRSDYAKYAKVVKDVGVRID
ncbi:MAG: tripartite tricarboxylate transporter substrate-binding protein, partial [Pseudomonadota bacterium]|nr:tripartite tricarboxylate transporter substrate-binding protein [Pseudomonadota bacterium]